MKNSPSVLSSNSIYKNKYTEVLVDKLRFGENEWEQVYFIKPHKKGVAIIPFSKRGIYLVKQYRHAIKKFLWQLPMGMIDSGTTEEETARNELLEEAGIRATKFTKIGSLYAEPGVIDQEEIIYVAENLQLTNIKPEINEIGLKVKHFSFKELKDMIKNGRIKCGFTLSRVIFLHNNYFKFL